MQSPPAILPTFSGRKHKAFSRFGSRVGERGSYKLVVADKSSIHNFTIEREKGGKFEEDVTSTTFTGTKTVTVKLGPGKWKYYCKVHEPLMFGFFTVT